MRIGGIATKVRVSASGGGVFAVGSNRAPNAGFEALQRASRADPTITIEFPPYKERNAQISWWKSGYLAAFAAYGYRYALLEEVQTARKRLLVEDDQSFSVFSVTMVDEPPSVRRLLIVHSPPELASLIVQMGRHGVVLPPWWVSRPGLYERIAGRGGDKAEFRGKEAPWPSGPDFALDFL
jgi:hypothetical protein